ncbi:hypothetical protein MBANPS3_001766 [Mucor bainieri]
MKSFNLKKPFTFLLSAIALNTVSGQPSVARSDASCGLVDRDIYCFGGVPAVGDNTLPDNTTMMIDLTTSNGYRAEEIKSRWYTETPNADGVEFQPRSHPQGMALPDGHRFLLSGGFNNKSPGLIADQTIVYDIYTKKWTKYANFVDGSFGNRQIYYASTVYVPDVGIGFYGGFEQNISPSWTMGTGQNLTKAEFNNGMSRVIGYPKMTFLNLNDSSSPWSVPPQSGIPRVYSAHQTSIYDSASKNVYFFGGEYYDIDEPENNQSTATRHPLSYSLFYNVESNSWGNQTWGGTFPSSRKYHTTTLSVSDFCYVLNLDTKQWVQQTIEASLATTFIRTRHSSVMEDDSDTLFILFGKNNAAVAVNDVLMLNTTDPKNISVYETYYNSMRWNDSQQSAENSFNNTPIIVGVCVGGTIAGIIAGFIIYFWRRRRTEATRNANTQKTQYIQTKESTPDRSQKNPMPVSHRSDTYWPIGVQPSLRDDEATLIGSDDAPTTRSVIGSMKPSNNSHPYR